MATMYCALCRRPVDAGRRIGMGTIVLAVLTGGLWLLAIPFYEKRCAICRSAAVSATAPDGKIADGASPLAQRQTLERRIADLEGRLSLTEGEVEATSIEIERMRAERDFDRQLLGNPARRLKKEESGSE